MAPLRRYACGEFASWGLLAQMEAAVAKPSHLHLLLTRCRLGNAEMPPRDVSCDEITQKHTNAFLPKSTYSFCYLMKQRTNKSAPYSNWPGQKRQQIVWKRWWSSPDHHHDCHHRHHRSYQSRHLIQFSGAATIADDISAAATLSPAKPSQFF